MSVFQFTASYEADLLIVMDVLILFIFQFTASYEADLWEYNNNGQIVSLSIHSLIRG